MCSFAFLRPASGAAACRRLRCHGVVPATRSVAGRSLPGSTRRRAVHSDSTRLDHRARQVRPDVPAFQAFDGEMQLAVAMFLRKHAADAGHLFQLLLHRSGIERAPSGGSTSTATVSAPRRRLVRFATVSVATSLPLAMMMTRSQICSTSGRMCVERIMVWSPARPLIRSRVSMI